MWILVLYISTTFHYFNADRIVYFGQDHMAADINKSVVMQEFNSKESCELALIEINNTTKLHGVCLAK